MTWSLKYLPEMLTRFEIARHRTQDRLKILAAFDDMPNAILMAHNKAGAFPRDEANLHSIRLHDSVDALYKTLLGVLPPLIKTLNPDKFRKLQSLSSNYTVPPTILTRVSDPGCKRVERP